MKSFSFLVIAFIFYQKATEGSLPPKQFCLKPHEEYEICGTACPLTCDNHLIPPKVCAKACVKGCACEVRYVRNRAGDCVLPRDCPRDPRCPANEIYSKCASACPLTCKNHLNPPEICTLQCVIGCQCKKGYVRDEITRKCVLPTECPVSPKCRLPHEQYSFCGSACPETCENNKRPRPCNQKCVEGCFCKPGYVRNKEKRCVLPREC